MTKINQSITELFDIMMPKASVVEPYKYTDVSDSKKKKTASASIAYDISQTDAQLKQVLDTLEKLFKIKADNSEDEEAFKLAYKHIKAIYEQGNKLLLYADKIRNLLSSLKPWEVVQGIVEGEKIAPLHADYSKQFEEISGLGILSVKGKKSYLIIRLYQEHLEMAQNTYVLDRKEFNKLETLPGVLGFFETSTTEELGLIHHKIDANEGRKKFKKLSQTLKEKLNHFEQTQTQAVVNDYIEEVSKLVKKSVEELCGELKKLLDVLYIKKHVYIKEIEVYYFKWELYAFINRKRADWIKEPHDQIRNILFKLLEDNFSEEIENTVRYLKKMANARKEKAEITNSSDFINKLLDEIGADSKSLAKNDVADVKGVDGICERLESQIKQMKSAYEITQTQFTNIHNLIKKLEEIKNTLNKRWFWKAEKVDKLQKLIERIKKDAHVDIEDHIKSAREILNKNRITWKKEPNSLAKLNAWYKKDFSKEVATSEEKVKKSTSSRGLNFAPCLKKFSLWQSTPKTQNTAKPTIDNQLISQYSGFGVFGGKSSELVSKNLDKVNVQEFPGKADEELKRRDTVNTVDTFAEEGHPSVWSILLGTNSKR